MEKLLDKCPSCGIGKIEIREIEKVISVDDKTKTLKVEVEACEQCQDFFYHPDTVRLIERIRSDMKKNDI